MKPKHKEPPFQLSLFSLYGDNEQFSNTIELYDAIPKYILGKDKFGERLNPIEREFTYKDCKYRVVIQPARLKQADGTYLDALPGQREELVEDALRKLATDGNAVALGSQIGVHFTLYKLKKELERTGHTYSYAELKEAIKILRACNMELSVILESGKREEMYSENLFSKMAGKTDDGWLEGEGSKSLYLVIFNSLVKKSIMSLTFRRYNYELCMKYKNVIARYLHKRLSHNYIQASMLRPYEILMSTIIDGSGMTAYAKKGDNHKYISKALEELKENSVLTDWQVEKKRGVDYKYTLVPSGSFVSEIKRTNQIQREMLSEAGKGQNSEV